MKLSCHDVVVRLPILFLLYFPLFAWAFAILFISVHFLSLLLHIIIIVLVIQLKILSPKPKVKQKKTTKNKNLWNVSIIEDIPSSQNFPQERNDDIKLSTFLNFSGIFSTISQYLIYYSMIVTWDFLVRCTFGGWIFLQSFSNSKQKKVRLVIISCNLRIIKVLRR